MQHFSCDLSHASRRYHQRLHDYMFELMLSVQVRVGQRQPHCVIVHVSHKLSLSVQEDTLNSNTECTRSISAFLSQGQSVVAVAVAIVWFGWLSVVPCCLFVVVVVCGGGGFVRMFVCSIFHVFVCGGYCVLCRCVCCAVLRRRLSHRCLRRCMLCVVVCRCLFVSEAKFLDLLENELPRL